MRGKKERSRAVPQSECCLLPPVSQSHPHSAWNVLGCYLQNLNALAAHIGLGQSYWGLASVCMRQHPLLFFPPLFQPHSFTVVWFTGNAGSKPRPLVQGKCFIFFFVSALGFQRRRCHLCKPHFASVFSQHMSVNYSGIEKIDMPLESPVRTYVLGQKSGNWPLVMSHTVLQDSDRIGAFVPPGFSVPF